MRWIDVSTPAGSLEVTKLQGSYGEDTGVLLETRQGDGLAVAVYINCLALLLLLLLLMLLRLLLLLL